MRGSKAVPGWNKALKRPLAAFGFAVAVAFSTPGLAEECEAMPGLEAVVPLKDTDYLLVGEFHGTTELPAAFASIACSVLKSDRPVVIGVEQGPEHQAALDAYMASDGGAEARTALMTHSLWTTDTRFSVAMLGLIETVRAWKAAGKDVSLSAFDELISERGTNAFREREMARRIVAAREARPGSIAVVLTGLGHAGREAFTFSTPPTPSMMMHLPADRSAGLAFSRSGGESWRCARPEGATAETCGPLPLTAPEPALERGVHPAPDLPAFNGRFSPGRVLTPSAPARAAS